jgi:hypothetical protein
MFSFGATTCALHLRSTKSQVKEFSVRPTRRDDFLCPSVTTCFLT